MNSRITPVCLALAAAFGTPLATPSHAQTSHEDLHSLDEVVVSASRAPTKLSETPVAIGKVGPDVLQRDKPRSMGEAINRIPGVHWNDLGNEQHSMSIRQPINTNAVYQFLEDGIPIRPLGVFNHNALNEVNLAGSAAVEVVKGAASSLYGSNAVGGAVNFLSAAPSRTPTAHLGLRHDDVNGYTRIDTGASTSWDALGLRFSHYSSRRRDNWQEHSHADKDSFTLRGDYLVSAAARLRATLVHTDLDTATSGSLFEDDYRNTPGKSLNSFTYRRDRMSRANLAWEGETTANGVSTLTFFTRKNDHGQLPSYTISNCIGASCRGTVNNNAVDSIGLDFKHEEEFDWMASRLVSGIYLDKSRNRFVSDNLAIARDPVSGRYLGYTVSSATTPRGVRDYEAGILNTAVFAQFEMKPFEHTRLVAGGRFDAIRYDFRNKLAPGGSLDYGAPDETRRFARFSPKIGASQTLAQNTSVYANLSQGFTPPEVSQLYGRSAIPDLRPGVYTNQEIGLRTAFFGGALKLDSALYRLDGRDTIVSYTISPGNSENRNAGRTRSQGLELGLSGEAGAFDGRIGFNAASHRFLRYQASTTLDYSGRTMPQAPRRSASAEIGYKPFEGARLAVEVVHQGAYFMNNANTVKYPGHTLLNLRTHYTFARGWEAWLHVNNLTDRRYAHAASSAYSGQGAYTPNTQDQYTPGAPRSVLLGLAYTFDAK